MITTLSDQGKTNVAAINIINSNIILDQGLENCNERYIIDEYEIVYMYNPPHLLKCIQNNLLTKNVKFILNNTDYTTSWKFVLCL